MTTTNKVHPQLELTAFNCPRCATYAKQRWFFMMGTTRSDGYGGILEDNTFRISSCEFCSESTILLGQRMIFPSSAPADVPNADLPNDVRADYEEALLIANSSARGAAALLRLAIQNLCKHLGQPGKNINADIKALVANGLPSGVQKALDIVRVIGNEAVHPGTLDLRDDRSTALALFKMVNFIGDKMITEPKAIEKLYKTLPEAKRASIEQRDRSEQSG